MFKKAQGPGQIFVYILAIVIVGVIITYGYTAIKDFSDRGEQVAFISFKTSFENTVKTMVSDYGSIKRPDFDVPQQYKRVCVVDFKVTGATSFNNPDPLVNADCTGTNPENYEPLACAAWYQGWQQTNSFPNKEVTLSNVFLTPDGSESFHVDNIEVPGGMLCVPIIRGKIKMQFTSLGDGVKLTAYD